MKRLFGYLCIHPAAVMSGLLLAGFSGLYALTAARLPVNYADSNDLLLAADTLSLAHSPGYPLYVVLLRLWLNVWGRTNAGWAAPLMNSLVSAIGVSVLFYLGYRWGGRAKNAKARSRSLWAAGIGAVLWGISQTVWLHATVVEVFPLAQLLTLMTLGSIGLWQARRRSGQTFRAAGIGVAGGLAILYHPLTILVVGPALGWVFAKGRRQAAGIAMGGLIAAGITAGLYVWLGARDAVYGWPILLTPQGMLDFFLRKGYLAGGSAIETYAGSIDVKHSVWSVGRYCQLLWQDLPGGILLAPIGLIALYRKQPRWGLVVAGLWAASGPVLAAYLKFPQPWMTKDSEYFWGTALRYRMFYPHALIWAGLLMMGMRVVLESRWAAASQRWLPVGLLIGVIGLTAARFPVMDSSRDNFDYVYAHRVLTSLPSQSVLIVDNDMAFAFATQQRFYPEDKGVTVVPARMPWGWKVALGLTGSDRQWVERETDPDRQVAALIRVLLRHGYRVFIYQPEVSLLAMVGAEGNPLFTAPYGYMLEIGVTMPEVIPAYDYGLSKQLATNPLPQTSHWANGIRGHLAELHTQLVYFYERLGYSQVAAVHKKLAQELASLGTTKAWIEAVDRQGQEAWAQQNSYARYVVPGVEEYLTKAREAESRQQSETARYFLDRAWIKEPWHPALFPGEGI